MPRRADGAKISAMTIARILVPVAGAECDLTAIAVAIAAARPFASHIVLLSIHEDPALAVPLVGVPLPSDAIESIIEGQTRHGNAAALRARATMRDICGREDIRIVPAAARGETPSCSFRQCWGNVAVGIGNEAALSDLVVLGPVCWDSTFNEAFLEVLRDVRRPILVAREAARSPRHIAIGWDGSAAAAHAVAAAMPYLERADAVSVLTVARSSEACAPVAELGDYLIRHGVIFAHREFQTAGSSSGDALLDAAHTVGADLLVAGAFGHDNLREALFGGATQTLAGRAGMPVLLAH